MSIFLEGTAKAEPTSVAYVSLWHLPGGYDAVNASVVVRYFDDMEEARRFAQKYQYPPEMAFMMEIKK